MFIFIIPKVCYFGQGDYACAWELLKHNRGSGTFGHYLLSSSAYLLSDSATLLSRMNALLSDHHL